MNQKWIVKVDCSVMSASLPKVELEPGDWVEWWFVNVPQETIPWIQFAHALGPFQCLQEVAPGVVQGKGNVGAATDAAGGEYAYQVLVLDAQGVPKPYKISGSVLNRSTVRNTSPEVVVEVDLKKRTLSTQPKILGLSVGDTAIWHVRNIPATHAVTFRFDGPLPPGANRLSGLFESILTSRDLEHPDALRVYGTGFGPPASGKTGSYQYYIDVRDPSGSIVASDDPVIDNLGQPGPPGDDPEGPRGKGGCLSSLFALGVFWLRTRRRSGR